MKRVFIFLILLSLKSAVFSQELYQVSFSGASTLIFYSFRTDQGVIIRVSPDGNVLQWGTEWEHYRYDYYPGKLQPYMARVDYYGAEADSSSRGKVKAIGTAMITYYPGSETPAKAGKIKSIGRLIFDYFDNFDNAALKGKIKMAGNTVFNYYSSYENESLAGKVKAAGNTAISYYSSFEDKLVKGKIKSIGSYNYSWYPSTAATGYQGSLKSGPMTLLINGVNYIIFGQ
jgi:hypothetical protein